MKSFFILVLGLLLGAGVTVSAVKYSPKVQQAIVVPCACAGCHCDPCVCTNCTCEQCKGKPAACDKKGCCEGHNLNPANECATPNKK